MEKFRSYFFFCFSAWNFLIYEFGKKQKHLVQLCNNTNLRGKGLCFQSMYGVCKSVICYVFLPLTDFLHFHCCFFLCCFLFLLLKISSAVLERRTVYFKLREWIISLPTTWPVLLFLCYHGLQFIQKVQDKIFVERSLVEVKLYVL